MPTMMETQRVSIAQLVQNVALEITANRSSDSPQYLSAFRLASALINLEMANELPVAVQRLRALNLDSTDYDKVCKIFCNISRVSEEMARYQRRLQSADLAFQHAKPAIRRMNQYLQERRAQILEYCIEARDIWVPPSLERKSDLSNSYVRSVHGQLSLYEEKLDKIACTFDLMSETFAEELYHPFMDQRLQDGKLPEVGAALDAINTRLQEIYDDVREAQESVKRKMAPYAARLAEMQRGQSQGQPVNSEFGAEGNITEKQETETVAPAGLEEEDNQPVAALRSELEQTLGATASSFRPLTSAGTGSSSDHTRAHEETATKSEATTKAKPSAVDANTRPVNGIKSAPLYAGTATASFSVVEEVVHRRGNHNRAATLESTSNYATTETGMPQLGSVTGTNGRSVPRVFMGSFDELEAGMSRLQVEGSDGSAARHPSAHESTIVRDFATPMSTTPGTPASIPPSPATLHYRREALLAQEAEVTPHSATRSQEASDHLHRDGNRSMTAGSPEAGPSRSDSSKRRRENTI